MHAGNYLVQVRDRDGTLLEQRLFELLSPVWAFIDRERARGLAVRFYSLCDDESAEIEDAFALGLSRVDVGRSTSEVVTAASST